MKTFLIVLGCIVGFLFFCACILPEIGVLLGRYKQDDAEWRKAAAQYGGIPAKPFFLFRILIIRRFRYVVYGIGAEISLARARKQGLGLYLHPRDNWWLYGISRGFC